MGIRSSVRRASFVAATALTGAGLFWLAPRTRAKRVTPETRAGAAPWSAPGGGTATGGISVGVGTGGVGIGTGTGGNTGSGGSGSPPPATCDPPAKMCPMGQICVEGADGGVCSPNGGPCDPKNDMCQNDTYCCGAGCRIDGSNDPVCVSGGTRPVNNSCNTSVAIGVFTPVLALPVAAVRARERWRAPAAMPDARPWRPTPIADKTQVLVTPLVADMPTRPAGATWSNIIIVTSDSRAVPPPMTAPAGSSAY